MEPILTIASKDFNDEIESLLRQTKKLANSIPEIKRAHINSEPTNCAQALLALEDIVARVQQAYNNFSFVENSTTLPLQLRKILQIEGDCIRAKRTLNRIRVLEPATPRELNETHISMAKTLRSIADPAKTIEEKIGFIQQQFENPGLDVEGESPRNIRTDRLKHFKVVVLQFRSKLPNESNHKTTLDNMIAAIDEKLQHIDMTFNHKEEASIASTDKIDASEVDAVLAKAVKEKQKISFWSTVPFFPRIFRHVKEWTPCELLGSSMETDFGTHVGGIASKLDRKLTKLLEGRITLDKVAAFRHKLNVYSACYSRLNDLFQQMHERSFALPEETHTETLFKYSKQLHYELSEIRYTISTLSTLSSRSALYAFAATKALEQHVSSQKNPPTLATIHQYIEYATEDKATLAKSSIASNAVRSVKAICKLLS